jgi:hypothetical protein
MDASGPSFTTTDNYSPGSLAVKPVTYRLGVPAPAGPMLVTNSTIEKEFEEGSPSTGGDAEQVEVAYDSVTVAYAYSFVDRYGHESSLSPASTSVELAYDRPFSVSLTASEPPPAGVNFSNGVRRVYRATFDGSSSAWQFIFDVSVGTTAITDTLAIGEESESAINEGWLPAPTGLKNLCLVSSAFAAGYFGNYVCYSEQKLPHAWPTDLQYPVKYTPKGLMPLLNGLLIVTNGRPYWAEGSDPYSALPLELPINAPCLSSESVVDMGGYAMYASDEGLVAVGPSTAEVVTSSLLDRATMENLVGTDCTAFKFEERYVFSTRDGRWLAFVPQQGFVEYDFGFPPSAFRSVTFSVRDNRHYFALADGSIREVDFEGSASDVEWRSKHWRTPATSFSVVRVEADKYPVTVNVRCQYLGQPWQESGAITISGPHIQRLPVMTGGLWQVAVMPPEDGRVYRIVLAQSGGEAS